MALLVWHAWHAPPLHHTMACMPWHAMQPHAAMQHKHCCNASASAGGGRIRLAVIDHIISLAPVHLPVAALCALCRRYGAASLVDGAHAVGAVALDLPSLGADYYTSNLHK